MKILIAEDEPDLLVQYQTILEDHGHLVTAADNGKRCVEIFRKELDNLPLTTDESEPQSPFDTVILDYQMPKMNGLEAAKEILLLAPKQRIIFASAYVQETLVDSIKNLKQIVELLQKPFGLQALVDTVEDKQIYEELEKLNVDIRNLRELNPTHAQVRDYLDALKKLQKGRTF